ncbi:FkbM family methyltransferase [Spizellomyces punctatus DAOM BR117]|uniref:FkbM family methyltransferase n=1 Tax=Spizellomyces punctatus (strain DAOM BR117) TaxID=645134 RepID=A0A0L0HLF9_SPIPD|nr:FkbM family methyltransferase [Spizellomyces punctatus DAOM BR117]KND01639.1 FkbM family methyltransferase [Spizellomyces punctatus DAOM BR117]|eukprot:XP_016609678.1 FkbM family methyltransferase [Spizellomyces punctatus DAOM BR117]
MATFSANRFPARTLVVAGILVITILLFLASFSSTPPSEAYGKLSQAAQDQYAKLSKNKGNSRPTRPIFIDLGANRGDSIRVFQKEPGSKWVQDFPKPYFFEYSDFECHLFEANPLFTKDLEQTKTFYAEKEKPVKVHIYPSTIVSTKDGFTEMSIDTWSTENDFWGSSIYQWSQDGKSNKQGTTKLPSVNFSKFLIKNFHKEDYVVVKMDIEGAEYEVLPHLVETGAYKLIDVLLVEWHPRHPAFNEADWAVANEAGKEMTKAGVFMPFYDSPA